MTDRFPGRLLLLDGATGHSMGHYLEMPGGLETYMSPVLHTRKDGSQYVLFGHGGETVEGGTAFLMLHSTQVLNALLPGQKLITL